MLNIYKISLCFQKLFIVVSGAIMRRHYRKFRVSLLWMTKGGNFIEERYPNGEKSKSVVLFLSRRTAEKI